MILSHSVLNFNFTSKYRVLFNNLYNSVLVKILYLNCNKKRILAKLLVLNSIEIMIGFWLFIILNQGWMSSSEVIVKSTS